MTLLSRSSCLAAAGCLAFVLSAATPCASALSFDKGDEQYNFVAGLFEGGWHEMVVEEASRFLDEFESHKRAPLVRYRLGQSLFELGRHGDALKTLGPLESTRSFEFATEVKFRIGQCLIETGKFAEAAERMDALGSVGTDHYLYIPALYHAGEAHFRNEQFASAARAYGKVLKATESDDRYRRDSLYGLGWSFYRAGRHDSAAQSFELFLREFPNDSAVGEMRFLRGESFLQLDQPREALDEFLSVPPGDYFHDALSGAGFACAELEDHEQAASLFLRLEQEAPAGELRSEGRLHAGIHSYKAGRMEQSAAVLDRLLADQQREWAAEANYWRGMAEAKLRGSEQAIGYFDQGLAVADGELRERLTLARSNALFDSGRFEEAEKGYSGVQSDDALYSSAVAMLNANKPGQAIQRAEAILENFSRGKFAIPAELIIGEGLFAQEKYESALDRFLRVLDNTSRASSGDRPRAMSRAAWCLFSLERYEEAAGQFARVLNEYPSGDRAKEASFLEGRCHLRAGNFPKAEQVLRRHLEAFSGTDFDDDARYDLAQSLLSQGKNDQADKELRLVTQSGKNSALGLRAQFERAELLAEAGRFDRAGELLREIIAAEPEPGVFLPALYSYGWACYELDRWRDARQALERLLSESPDGELAAPSLELLATVARASGNGDQAENAYRRLQKVAPRYDRNPEVALVAALALRETGKLESAARVLEETSRDWPGFSGRDRLLYELSHIYRDLDRPEDSQRCLVMLENEFQGSKLAPDAAFERGESLFAAGDFRAALEAYQGARNRGSRVRDLATYKSGWCQFRVEDYPAAARTFLEVNQNFPESVVAGESLFLAGECLYQQEQYDQVRRVLADFLDRYPDHESKPKALFRYGIAQGELGSFEECLSSLQKLEKAAPDFEQRLEAELWIGRSLLAADRLQEAERRFQKVADRDRTVLAARAILGLGHCAMARKDYKTALGEFLKVALLYEGTEEVPEALWFAGNCLEESGDLERAADRYRELIENHPDHPRSQIARERVSQIRSM